MAREATQPESKRHLAVVDAHCHIDLYQDPAAVVWEAESLCVRTIAVTNAPSVYDFTNQITKGLQYVRPAAGLHPELVHSHEHELPLLLLSLEETRYVGEVGLDYVTNDAALRKKQRDVFSAVVERCGALGGKVLTIHSRRAATDVISIIGRGFPGRAILHWFSGTFKELEMAMTAGHFFSVNTSMLNSRSGEALVRAMPTDRVLTETDGPFVKVDGLPATPPDTSLAVKSLARLWGINPDAAKNRVAANFDAAVS